MFIHYDFWAFKRDVKQWHWKDISPDLYYPKKLDTDQWVRTAKAMGAKYAILTAKHGTGFLQWQSDAYSFGLKQSLWRNGKGDLVRDFVESCRKYGIKPGIYCHLIYGQRVRAYVVETLSNKTWREIARGISIGHKKIDRFKPTEVSKLRFRCTKSAATPVIRKFAAYNTTVRTRK